MIEIKDLLVKYEKMLLSKESKREAVRRAVSSALNIEIKPEDVEIKNNTVYLRLKSIYKNEVFIKKEKILTQIDKGITVL